MGQADGRIALFQNAPPYGEGIIKVILTAVVCSWCGRPGDGDGGDVCRFHQEERCRTYTLRHPRNTLRSRRHRRGEYIGWAKKTGPHDHNYVNSKAITEFFSLEDFWVNLQLNGYQKSHRALHMLLNDFVKYGHEFVAPFSAHHVHKVK